METLKSLTTAVVSPSTTNRKSVSFGLSVSGIAVLVYVLLYQLVGSVQSPLLPLAVTLVVLLRSRWGAALLSGLIIVLFQGACDFSQGQAIVWISLARVGAVVLAVLFGGILRASYEQSEEEKRALSQAVRIRDEFLAIAAHEIRGPLNVLSLQMEILNATHLHKHKNVDRAKRQITQLNDLVSSILDVTKMSDGKIDFHPGPFDLNEMVEAFLEDWEQELQARGCSVTLSLPSIHMIGNWDKLRLQQVLANLLTNACKYAPGRIEVSIDGDDQVARLIVRDHGHGIPDDALGVLFRKFGRVTTDRRVAGLGLGLWIVKQIVESHQGTVRVESELGKGTSFIVVLPRNI